MEQYQVIISTVKDNVGQTIKCNAGRGILSRGDLQFRSLQSLSHVRLFDPMDCSMPGFPVHHQFLKLAQTYVHQVGDAIQPSHPLNTEVLEMSLKQSFAHLAL